jgi:hypothetical protein
MEYVYGRAGVRLDARNNTGGYLFFQIHDGTKHYPGSWNYNVPFVKMRDQGGNVLYQVIDLVITTITVGRITRSGFFFLTTARKTGDLLVIIASLAEQYGY